jgi:rare lipoprotein A
MKLIILWILLAMLNVSCTTAIRFSDAQDKPMKNQSGNSSNKSGQTAKVGYIFKGKASFYADKYDGRKTASGEVFSQSEFTAAHKTLAFGTKCKVTNVKNGKSVEVVINDRGPFVKGRVIDLSKSAAIELDFVKAGVADVEVEIIE